MRRVLAAPVRGEERGEVREHLGCQHCHNLGHNLLRTTRNCRQKVQFSFGLDLAINNKSWNLAWLLQMKSDYLRKSINKKNWFLICVLCPIYPDVLDYDCVNSCCGVDEILHKILIQGVPGIHHWQVERSDLWLRLTPAVLQRIRGQRIIYSSTHVKCKVEESPLQTTTMALYVFII